MAEPQGPIQGGPSYVVVGANHRSAPSDLRDSLAQTEEDAVALLGELGLAGVGQTVVIATCDRVDVVAAGGDAAALSGRIAGVLARRSGLPPSVLAGQTYALSGAAAVRYLFAVAGSLESLVLGEPEVLGQVKAADRLARAAGTMGRALDPLFQAAFASGKRVRTETAIGERPVSLAAAAVAVARDVHGDLGKRIGAVVGATDTAELLARHFRDSGLTRIEVAHRSPGRAAAFAQRLVANTHPFDRLDTLLARADILIAGGGTSAHTITREAVAAALKARRREPMLVLDVGVPPDADPTIDRLDGAFLYTLEDLERVAALGRADRAQQAAHAWAIVDEDVARFLADRAGRAAVPAIVALREAFERERARVLAEHPRAGAEEATRLLVNRLLHAPSESLRLAAADAGAMEAMLRRLFADADHDTGKGGA